MPAQGGKSSLIAGEGVLPVEIARRLSEQGTPPVVITMRDDLETFSGISAATVQLRYPRLGRVIKEIKRHGATSVIMAGRVAKKFIYLPLLFDPTTLKVIARSAHDDHSILGSIVKLFEDNGIAVLPYWQILPEFIACEGRIGHRDPTAAEQTDVEAGAAVLRVILPCSFGQALIVADRGIVAVEAMEGTDEMIKRAGDLVGKGVLVKMMRRDQDPRYDLPTVGPQTIENMSKAGLSCLALEARRAIIVDVKDTLALAEKRNIAIWGLPCQSS